MYNYHVYSLLGFPWVFYNKYVIINENGFRIFAQFKVTVAIFSKLFIGAIIYLLSPLKAAFLCVVSSALVTAFKVLYKESIETVDRPSIKPPTKK